MTVLVEGVEHAFAPTWTRRPLTRAELDALHRGDVLQFTRDVSWVKLSHWDRQRGVHLVVETVAWYQGYVLASNTLSGRTNVLMNDGTFGDLRVLARTPEDDPS